MVGLSRIAVAATLLIAFANPGQAGVLYHAQLAPEAPGATGSGNVTLEWDPLANTLQIDATWSGLSGLTTVSHIHCCIASPGTVGVAVTPGTLPGFPQGVSSGSYSFLLDLTSAATFTGGFVTNFAGGDLALADDALIAGLDAGQAYLNIHTDAYPAGEIRGFLARVPEPASLALLGLGFVALGLGRRRRA